MSEAASAGGSQPSVWVQRNSGIISTGPNATNKVIRLPDDALRPTAEVDCPPGLANLPERPGLFVGRAAALDRLDDALAGPGGAVVQAVHGLGGIGKSVLAAHWAGKHASSYALVWWITADTPADIDAGLAGLAVALQPILADALPLEALRERAVQWLSAHSGWLVILDNVNEPADVKPLLARATTGRFLITSRRASGWHGIAAPVRLDVLTEAEALDLLAKIVMYDRRRDLDGAAGLCEELGYLPLAIVQAGAYIAQGDITPRRYLDLLAQYPAKMYQQTAEPHAAQRGIARIWRVTLDQLADTPHAVELLQVLAFFAPDNIPRSLIGRLTDPPTLLTAIVRLAAYSMIMTAGDTLAVHRLVQAVARTPDASDPYRSPYAVEHAREQATTLLTIAAPPWEDPAGWPTWRALLPHAEALAKHTSPTTDTPSTADLLSHAAAFMENQGAVARAIPLYERALAVCSRVLGKDHPRTLDCRNNLATAYGHAGDMSRAVPLFEATLQDRTRVLGEDHPDTLATRGKVAFVYEVSGDLARAIPLYKSAYEDCLRALGPDHPQTLTALCQVATAYSQAGDLDRAVPQHEKALADCLRLLGKDHPRTLDCRNNLATAYGRAGDLSRATKLYEDLVQDCRRVLGENHPDTLSIRGHLAGVYLAAKDLNQAIPLHERVLADCLRVLGEDHYYTLEARKDLAYAYLAADDLNKAIQLWEQTLAGYRRVLGENHPDTLGTRINLASCYEMAGDLDRAMRLYESAYEDCLRVLGPNHPHTLIADEKLSGDDRPWMQGWGWQPDYYDY